MPKKFWQFRNQAAGSAELLLYGDISDSSWWGDEVTPKTFADELNALGALTSLTVRINSGGGDVFAAQTIGNLLEQHTAQVTARIDGLCASAATIIACHCDKVVAANDSTYMIHPVRMGIFDFADAVTLQQYITETDTDLQSVPFDFEDVNTPEFPHNWKKGTGDKPFTMDITCRSIQLVFKDSGSKEFGAAAVTVDGKEVAVYDPRQAGWTHCHAAIILREETVQKHHIQIKMQETCTDKVFTILGFGVL